MLYFRKEGRERLIRIIQRQNLFGFREELLHFASLKDLVLHFRDHSLEDYNPKLNIKLKYPCGKPDQIRIENVINLLKLCTHYNESYSSPTVFYSFFLNLFPFFSLISFETSIKIRVFFIRIAFFRSA